MIYQLVGGLRQSMGYVGAATIEEMQRNTRFIRVTGAERVRAIRTMSSSPRRGAQLSTGR